MAERAFIIIPLADIAPDLIHPSLGKTIQQLKAGLDPSSVKLYQSTSY
jgi:7,8-dihydro-6-hydroxymethylpterin-pyrophosphokinase